MATPHIPERINSNGEVHQVSPCPYPSSTHLPNRLHPRREAHQVVLDASHALQVGRGHLGQQARGWAGPGASHGVCMKVSKQQ